jgi:hypothetical protein
MLLAAAQSGLPMPEWRHFADCINETAIFREGFVKQ